MMAKRHDGVCTVVPMAVEYLLPFPLGSIDIYAFTPVTALDYPFGLDAVRQVPVFVSVVLYPKYNPVARLAETCFAVWFRLEVPRAVTSPPQTQHHHYHHRCQACKATYRHLAQMSVPQPLPEIPSSCHSLVPLDCQYKSNDVSPVLLYRQ